MNLCFVGYGAIAGVHAEICRRLGHRFHTVVGRDPASIEAFAWEWGFSHSTLRLQDALTSPGVDAVFICSPSEAHEAQARQTIEAGKPVLVELPAGHELRRGAGHRGAGPASGIGYFVTLPVFGSSFPM